MSEWTNRSDVVDAVSCLLERGLSSRYVYDGVYAVDGKLQINRNVVSVFADIHRPVNGSPPRTEISIHIDVDPTSLSLDGKVNGNSSEADLTNRLCVLTGVPLRVKVYNGMKPAVVLEGEDVHKLMDDVKNVVRRLSGNGYSFVSDYVRV